MALQASEPATSRQAAASKLHGGGIHIGTVEKGKEKGGGEGRGKKEKSKTGNRKRKTGGGKRKK